MRRSGLRLLTIASAALALAGCEWFSTMADNPGISPHEREPLLPPPHAVALDGMPEFDLATADQALTAPPAADASGLTRGEAAYRDFCYVCHGEGGVGGGPVSRVFPAIPAINTDRVAGYTDAYVFALISKGRGLMPEYSRIPVAARWELVSYVRSLPRGAAPAAGAAASAGNAAPAGGAAPAPAGTSGGS